MLWLLISLVITVLVFLFFGKLLYKPIPIGSNVIENQKQLKKIIDSKGINAAYKFFKNNFVRYDSVSKHYVGHFLGQEAYRVLGDEGLEICDFGLDYGCIHGFVIAGISEKGNTYVTTAMNRCSGFEPDDVRRGSCVHGVSHTLLFLKGYKDADLIWALSKCDDMLSGDEYVGPRGCYEAVFMEYNLRNLDGRYTGKWFETRPFDYNNPLAPCDRLEPKYRGSCYSELGSMWSNNIGTDFDKMATFCSLIKSKEDGRSCFWGIGRSMADDYNFDYRKVVDTCERVSGDYYASCITGAVVVLSNNGVSASVEICETLEDDEILSCKSLFK